MSSTRSNLAIASILALLALSSAPGCDEAGSGSQTQPASGGAQSGASGSSQAGTGAGNGSGASVNSSGGAGGSASGAGGSGAGGSSAAGASGGSGGSGGSTQGGGSGAGGFKGGSLPTDANLKVAFVGDTDDGEDWQAVASLILSEQAAAVGVAGDMTYTDDPATWWTATEAVLGQEFPVFLARGNHDDNSWTGFLSEAAEHTGAATVTPGAHDASYKALFRGLSIVTIRKGDSEGAINDLLAGDQQIWKVCLWHQNMETMQVGEKTDEMGWGVYEACRNHGALIISGHEHTYHRTKTLTSTQNQVIDATCADGAALCVGPGRTFVSVTGLGGTGIREQIRCEPAAAMAPFPSLNTADPSCPIWASIYTSDQGATFGAQFFVFNVDGDPRKARGYFKNVDGDVIDEFSLSAD